MPPPVSTFTGRVRQTFDLTHDVREIRIDLVAPPRLDFLPGQFVSFEIERPGARFKATRAYSMVSSPDDATTILLLLNRVEGGPGSEHLFALAAGDETTFRGPFGSFTVGASPRDALFVAEDTGIAPIRSMLSWMAAHDPARRATLFWGLRSERDLYYQRELDALRERMPGFSYTISLSAPGPGWQGAVAPVTQLADARVTSVDNLEVFICGGSGMIAAVAAAIKAKGLCPIRKEQYYIDKPSAPRPAP